MTTALPDPVVRRRAHGAAIDVHRLEADLRDHVDGEVRFDAGARGAYATDASNYRQVPIGVVVPRSVDAVEDLVAVCRRHRAPVLARGGGTSLAGQCTNVAVVVDFSKHLDHVVSVDEAHRTCIVEPGIVRDELNRQLAARGLEFGPKPSTHDHCTIGGMIGNNACGSTAQRAGKTVDNVARLEVLTYDGLRMWVGPTSDDELRSILEAGGPRADLYRALCELRDDVGDEVRRRFPHIPRRVSGYNLDSLLPEQGFDVARAIVGSEGTLVTVLRAELHLVPVVAARTVVMLAFPDIAAAADAVPTVLRAEPIALEGMDAKLVDLERAKHLNPEATDLLPEGGAWLLAETGGDDKETADARADALLGLLERDRDSPDVCVYDDPRHEREIWAVRESGLGATARSTGHDTWPGWEDSAVAPEQLGRYLRDLHALFDEFGFGETSIYGHFGQGCVHCRIPFDLTTASGVVAFRAFVERAAHLVHRYGGSLSGEHGDGQARGELLRVMFGEEIVDAFERFKAIFDPDDRMNPGKVVHPNSLDDQLRLGTEYDHRVTDTHFGYPDDDGSFARSVLRCVGVGECRRTNGDGVMCPSYVATRDEEHSTRGRARLLFEMLDGDRRGGPVVDGWRSKAVLGALDLCLACKGCKSDCPVHVDMATLKAEFLSHHYARRLRPRSHYAMGWLPLWAAAAAHAPRLTNALTGTPVLRDVVTWAGGIDHRRRVPRFARRSFTSTFRGRSGGAPRREVILWPDTFTNRFHPWIADAAVEVLEAAGWDVTVPAQPLCCGLTLISTGQLALADRVLGRTLAHLREPLRRGALVVGLEPSCTAVFRNDAHDLRPTDPDVDRLRTQTVTLAELLLHHTPGWSPPILHRRTLVQTHCHDHAVLAPTAEHDVLRAIGAEVAALPSGCCGLAGNFGFERGHHDISMTLAERALLPQVRSASARDVIVADGFSCRTQIEQGDSAGRRAVHLAQVVRAALRGDDGSPYPERAWSGR